MYVRFMQLFELFHVGSFYAIIWTFSCRFVLCNYFGHFHVGSFYATI